MPSIETERLSLNCVELPSLATRCKHCDWFEQDLRFEQLSQISPGSINHIRASTIFESSASPFTILLKTTLADCSFATESAIDCKNSIFIFLSYTITDSLSTSFRDLRYFKILQLNGQRRNTNFSFICFLPIEENKFI